MESQPLDYQFEKLIEDGGFFAYTQGVKRRGRRVFWRPTLICQHWILSKPTPFKGRLPGGKYLWDQQLKVFESIAGHRGSNWKWSKKRSLEVDAVGPNFFDTVLKQVAMVEMGKYHCPAPDMYFEARLDEAQVTLFVVPECTGAVMLSFPVPKAARDENGDPERIYFNADYVLEFARLGLNLFYLPDPEYPGVLTSSRGTHEEISGLLMPCKWKPVKKGGSTKIVAEQGTLVFDYYPVR